MDLLIILASAAIGMVCHFGNRVAQKRTKSTFHQYFIGLWGYTMGALGTTILACGAIYSATPENLEGKALMLLFFAGFGAGFGSDSIVNRDPNPGGNNDK